MKRIITALVIASAGLVLAGCSAAPQTTEPENDTLEVGDCFWWDRDATFQVGCDGDHNRVVFALPETTATTDAGIRRDMDELCDAAADPDRLDDIEVLGPDTDDGGTITCMYVVSDDGGSDDGDDD